MIQVSVALLLHPGLGAAAKVVWMASRLSAPGNPTGPVALAAAAGWDLARAAGHGPTAHALLIDYLEEESLAYRLWAATL